MPRGKSRGICRASENCPADNSVRRSTGNFCRKRKKKLYLLTFNTDAVEICANVKKIAHY